MLGAILNGTDIGNGQDYPKIYYVKGLIANSSGGVYQGHGIAAVMLYANGIAEIQYNYRCTTAGTDGNIWLWGLNRDLLHNLNSEIPIITPMTHGICNRITTGGSWDIDRNDGMAYGGISMAVAQFWAPGRMYTIGGDLGQYPENWMAVDQSIQGTAYGTFGV